MAKPVIPLYRDMVEYWEAHKKSRMYNWWNKIKDLPINQPRTFPINISKYYDPLRWRIEPVVADLILETIKRNGFKLPVFIRGEHKSGKFKFYESCYLETTEKTDILHHVLNILGDEAWDDFYSEYLFIREYIEPEEIFHIYFRNTKGEVDPVIPISKEVRVYTVGGRPAYWTLYWPKDAIKKNWVRTYGNLAYYLLPADWEHLYNFNYDITEEDLKEIIRQANILMEAMEGDWSLDFLKGRDGKWYLIDMADIRVSWRPTDPNLIHEVNIEG